MSRFLVIAVRNRGPSKEMLPMKITRRVLVSIILAIGMLIAPATAILATAGSAAAGSGVVYVPHPDTTMPQSH
jgi:hypothetical protein